MLHKPRRLLCTVRFCNMRCCCHSHLRLRWSPSRLILGTLFSSLHMIRPAGRVGRLFPSLFRRHLTLEAPLRPAGSSLPTYIWTTPIWPVWGACKKYSSNNNFLGGKIGESVATVLKNFDMKNEKSSAQEALSYTSVCKLNGSNSGILIFLCAHADTLNDWMIDSLLHPSGAFQSFQSGKSRERTHKYQKTTTPLGEIPDARIYVLLTYHLLIVFVRPSRDGVGLALGQQPLLDPLQIGGESHPGLHFAKNNREKWGARWKEAPRTMTRWQTAFCCLLKTRLQKLFSGIKSCHTSAPTDEITAKACVVSWYMTHKSGMYQVVETRCPFSCNSLNWLSVSADQVILKQPVARIFFGKTMITCAIISLLHAWPWQALRNFYKVRLVIAIPPQMIISAATFTARSLCCAYRQQLAKWPRTSGS